MKVPTLVLCFLATFAFIEVTETTLALTEHIHSKFDLDQFIKSTFVQFQSTKRMTFDESDVCISNIHLYERFPKVSKIMGVLELGVLDIFLLYNIYKLLNKKSFANSRRIAFEADQRTIEAEYRMREALNDSRYYREIYENHLIYEEQRIRDAEQRASDAEQRTFEAEQRLRDVEFQYQLLYRENLQRLAARLQIDFVNNLVVEDEE